MAKENAIRSRPCILENCFATKDKLKDLDERIASLLEDPDEMEQEAFEPEDKQDIMDKTSSQISSFL
ncbi:hypothetical protein P5673_011963 [Acropora cervicornis]|uniref:Uncharacterized protein n=1 Tax=Acropora cervicornis TaxID=6130 RepID=A0AAD9QNH4_ACRCE|nr:hypothetical protein P5673_011963 [Acropora cervicornis]